MSAFIVLGVGLLCALIARALIIVAAFRISWGWGLGVLLPFGPMAFRRKYPEDARPARPFQLATLPCLLLYFFLGPGMGASIISRPFSQKTPALAPMPATGYALEKPQPSHKRDSGLAAVSPSAPTIEQRRVANAHEIERLVSKDKELKLRKRDLLRSDVEGNASYARDLAEYNADLAKANAEKNELAKPAH